MSVRLLQRLLFIYPVGFTISSFTLKIESDVVAVLVEGGLGLSLSFLHCVFLFTTSGMLFRYCSEVDWVWFEFDWSEVDFSPLCFLFSVFCFTTVFSVSPPVDVVPIVVGGGLGAARPLLYCS